MVLLFHENQVYRGLLPRIILYFLLRFFIKHVIKLVEHSAKLKIVINYNVLLV